MRKNKAIEKPITITDIFNVSTVISGSMSIEMTKITKMVVQRFSPRKKWFE
jgi:hypothetical protein